MPRSTPQSGIKSKTSDGKVKSLWEELADVGMSIGGVRTRPRVNAVACASVCAAVSHTPRRLTAQKAQSAPVRGFQALPIPPRTPAPLLPAVLQFAFRAVPQEFVEFLEMGLNGLEDPVKQKAAENQSYQDEVRGGAKGSAGASGSSGARAGGAGGATGSRSGAGSSRAPPPPPPQQESVDDLLKKMKKEMGLE